MALSAALPETLRSVTSTKIQELRKQRDQFEAFKNQALNDAEPATDDLEKTALLLNAGYRHAGVQVMDDDFSGARKDPAFTPDLVRRMQTDLLKDLELESVQRERAQFFSELVTEWLSSSESSRADQPAQDVMEDSSFESVGRKEMHEQRAQDYLNQLFKNDEAVSNAFKEIETSTKTYGDLLQRTSDFFSPSLIESTVQGVLQTDLLSGERTATLKSFQNNKVVLQEVADVLNMRFSSLETWKWTTIHGAIPVEQRRQLNGKYRVFMDEDVLDALLLHSIGMKWTIHFKSCLTNFFQSLAWKTATRNIPKIDQDRRLYFLNETDVAFNTVDQRRWSQYKEDYFLTQLPMVESEGTRGYGDEDDELPKQSRKSPLEIKQSLLHLLITEALIAKHLRPGISHHGHSVRFPVVWSLSSS
ncbi:uncharacterized protein Z518_11232 [Rhinocladiella mackenziei CBS 650.93]|uniref:Uncharacterized protein n=1 Tax=Rhinocladiella mackenziei CBS 650.93 TaxID=1442369 RepID=A0A0D2I1C5_9EURO|nr:uncharacterized protein Z518_11232 [Rhinocladiella mackenziei CBS 650.93]KIW99493.1 hypothetical protein Z518_11232 [Rhinocladiella mackenziei CBS 650.93]